MKKWTNHYEVYVFLYYTNLCFTVWDEDLEIFLAVKDNPNKENIDRMLEKLEQYGYHYKTLKHNAISLYNVKDDSFTRLIPQR